MTGPVDPVSPAPRARPVRRRLQMLALRRKLEDHASRDEPAVEAPPAAAPGGPPTDAAVAAQLMGESARRGLRAGYEVREQARAVYLENEFAGPRDRRARKGLITKTEV